MELNLLPLLLVVAEERNFRAAADRLGVTRSAVSQGILRLEDAVGLQLVMRTTRAVRLTEAGERLVDSLRAPLGSVRDALEVNSDSPSGRLRLAVSSIAENFLSGPLLARFAQAHPKIIVDVTVTDEELDIVAHGYDAGVRLGEVIEQEMIAVPVSGPQSEVAAASPRLCCETWRARAPEGSSESSLHRLETRSQYGTVAMGIRAGRSALLHDGRPESLSLDLRTRHGESRRTFTLGCAHGVLPQKGSAETTGSDAG